MCITYIIIPFYTLKNNQVPGNTPFVNIPAPDAAGQAASAKNQLSGRGG
jgi:hypothetical protein